MQDGPRVRTNGFQRPFHPLQVLSWVVFGTDVLVFIVTCLPLIDTVGAKVVVSLAFAMSVVILVIATVKATSCDPADPHVHCSESELQGADLDAMPYCTICNVPVYPRSKHCRACNKCVSVFDHHCMWLNNCVGRANYGSFFATVSAVAVMIGIVLSTCLYLLIDYYVNEDFVDRLEAIVVYRSLPEEFFLGLFILMVAVNAPLFLLDMQLVLLHVFLWSQDLTTYEYIMNKREITRPDGGQTAGRNLRGRMKTLPHCMDWIVFSRCGQKRRKPQKTSVERIDPNSEKTVDAKVEAEAGGDKPAACPVGSGPSPPGSTADAADCHADPETASGAQTVTSSGAPAQGGPANSPAGNCPDGSDDILE